MKTTFKELVSGDEYQKHASEFCKALIFISVKLFGAKNSLGGLLKSTPVPQ